MICQELYKMATIPAYPCCIAVIHPAARGSLISASKTGSVFLSLEVGEGVGESNGNIFPNAQSHYIGEKLYLSGFIFKKSDSASDYLLSHLHTSYFNS